jgi:biotin operon repressor
MSIQAVGWALAQNISPSSAKFVLVAIANYADENCRCWPSQQRLANDTSLTERSIRSAIIALEELGYVKRVERRRQDGSRAADLIEIIGLNPQPEKSSGGVENPSEPTGNNFRTNRKSTADQPENISGLTTFEPSKNHQEPLARARDLIPDPVAKLKIDIVRAFSEANSTTLMPDTHRAAIWIEQGYSAGIILATIREVLARKPNVTSLSYFDRPIADAHAVKAAPIAKSVDPETEWTNKLRRWRSKGDWPGVWGDPPGHPCCKIPEAFIEQFDTQNKGERAA